MMRMIQILCAAALITGPFCLRAFSEEAAIPDLPAEAPVSADTGITRPSSRVDIRYQFATVPRGGHQDVYTLRGDTGFKFSGGWGLALRADVPAVYGDARAADNRRGKLQFGLGDILTQAAGLYYFSSRVAAGAGLQLVWPSATNGQSGTGTFQARPLGGVRVWIPEISSGSYFEGYARYAVSYAGSLARSKISKLVFAPTFNFMLPLKIFISLYSSPEIAYDFIQKAWTVPMNFMVGETFGDSIVASIEFFIPMFEDTHYKRPYDFQFEARVGYSF